MRVTVTRHIVLLHTSLSCTVTKTCNEVLLHIHVYANTICKGARYFKYLCQVGCVTDFQVF